MSNVINFSAVSAVTVLSMGLALAIEAVLLKVVFSCLARVKTSAAEGADERKWDKQSVVKEIRSAGM